MFATCESKLYQPTASEGLTNDSHYRRENQGFGSIQESYELGEQAKVVQMLTGVGTLVTTKGGESV